MGESSEKTETNSTPLPEIYERLQQVGWPAVDDMFSAQKEFYPNSTVVNRDRFSGAARDLTSEYFGHDTAGGPTTAEASKAFHGDVIGGAFMGGPGSNPMLDERFKVMSDRISESYKRIVGPQTATRFAAAGRTGSGAYNAAIDMDQRNLGETLGRTATDVYYGDYENRMRDRMQALGMGGLVQGMQMNEIGATRQQGMIEEDWDRQYLNEDIARHDFSQNEMDVRLDQFLNRLGQSGAGFGRNTTKTQSSNGNIGAQIGLGLLGSATSLAGAGMMGGAFSGAMAAAQPNMMDAFAQWRG